MQRWSILRDPLLFSLPKVAPAIMCLYRLNNFCIDSNESVIETMTVNSAQNVQRCVNFSNKVSANSTNESPVSIDENGCPTDLLNARRHFYGSPKKRKSDTDYCPMNNMVTVEKDKIFKGCE